LKVSHNIIKNKNFDCKNYYLFKYISIDKQPTVKYIKYYIKIFDSWFFSYKTAIKLKKIFKNYKICHSYKGYFMLNKKLLNKKLLK